ncbi:MAG: PAS domain S-box protein [Acidobacteriota bacterium]
MTDDFRALFDANPRPMFVFDRDSLAFLLVNAAACELYGWSRDELLAMTLRDIRPPEDVPRLERAVADVRGLPRLPSRPARHATRSGRLIDVVLDMTRVPFRGGTAVLLVVTDITGAREQEHRMRLFMEHLHEGMSLIDPDGSVRYMSPAGERLLGLEPGELVGKPAYTPAHPDDRNYVLAPGETRTHLTRARHRDGTWLWIESTATNLTLDPAVRGFLSAFRDVTKRIEAERAAGDARRRLEFLLSATSAITYSAKAHDDFAATYLSPSVRDVLGWDAADFTGDSRFWVDNMHPDDREAVDAGLGSLFETGTHSFEYRFRHRDGNYRWLLDNCRLVRDEAGHPVELVGYMIDVTERKQAEDALRRSEAQFRTLIERSPMLILVHRGGRIVYVNPVAVARLGYERADELVGEAVLELVHPEDRESVRERMGRTVSHGSGAPGEARMRRRDGSWLYTEGEGMVLDFDGEPATVVIGQDITERRELFARMALADRLLSVGTLAAGVAHEINNPLAYVSSNLELLKRELPLLLAGQPSNLQRGEIEELLADARDGAARVGSIVRDLRALSRSDDDSAGPVDVASVIASCIKMANNEIRHRARVRASLAGALPAATGNASRLGQVFLNLLVNAAQAIPEGSVDDNEVRVRAFAGDSGREVIVEVEDTGAGIPRPLLDRIFDPFFTTKPVGLGTGLGLSISHQIVRSLGGRIEVASEVGVGTTFRVVLPVTRAATPSPEPPAAPEPATPARVLVIDDEPAVGRSIALLLSPDYDVATVTRARDALELLSAGERFDAIVCDVMMPDMSGIELYQQLAHSAPDSISRLVFLTGGAFTPQAQDFLTTARRPHLDKPFTERALRQAIESVRDCSADRA